MTPARNSPSTRTLGSQLVEISTVLALIDRMFLTASRPMPVIATSRKATTTTILARIEYMASMVGNLLGFLGAWGAPRCDKAELVEGVGRTLDCLPHQAPAPAELVLIWPPVKLR